MCDIQDLYIFNKTVMYSDWKKKKEDIDPYLELNIFIYIAPETLNILYLELN